MNDYALTEKIINKSISVHKTLGPGLLESVYETALTYELRSIGLCVKTQLRIPFIYKGITLKKAFIADMLINNKVILEIKSQEINQKIYRLQLLSYLRLAKKEIGLVLNFGQELMKDGIIRVVNDE